MSSDFGVSTSAITQTVTGDRNIFTGTGDVTVVYNLPQADAEDRRGLLILLDRVKQFWVEGVLEQSVQHEALINLGKETKADAVEHPWEQVVELPNAASQRTPPDTRVADVFEQVGRLLLILGEPGSGKTVTLLELARDLVARARSDPSQPVPVIFNLSSWNEKFSSLSDWVTEELKTKYLIPKRIGRSWVDVNRLSLLLDGLDEVQADRRAACIRAINAFLEDQGTPGLVVCSRLQEYTAEPVRLKMNGAICLQPLSATQIEKYLSRLGGQLDALLAALNKDDVLRDLAKSPLMLSVMTLAYQGASMGALSADQESSAESRRSQIFATYIQRMFERKGRQGSLYPKKSAITWLSWLANKMLKNSQTVFSPESLQPTWLSNARQIAYYYSISRFTVSMVAWGATFGVSVIAVLYIYPDVARHIIMMTFFMSSQMVIYNLFLLLLLFSGAFLIDFTRCHLGVRRGTSSPVRSIIDSPLVIFIAYIVSSMSAAVIASYLSVRLAEDPSGGAVSFSFSAMLPSMLISGCLPGTLLGLAYCRRTCTTDVRFLDYIRWSWKNFAIFWGVVCVLALFGYAADIAELDAIGNALAYPVLVLMSLSPFSVLLGLKTDITQEGARWVGFSWARAVYPGLFMYAIAIIISVLMRQMGDAPGVVMMSMYYLLFAFMPTLGVILSYGVVDILNHSILRSILYRNGRIPPKYDNFLKHCTKLVFLRRVGYGYIFIHRLLLEHFAGMWDEGRDRGEPKGTVA